MNNSFSPSRRDAIGAVLAVAGATAGLTTATNATPVEEGTATPIAAGPTGNESDFDFLAGSWRVRHRRLKARLAGSTEWEQFDGTSTLWPTLGGLGTVDDNVIELPAGTYRAVGIRAFDIKTRQWSIWWLDLRNPVIDAPVQGGFNDGVGTFLADEMFEGRPIKVRFRWSEITPNSAKWDQAFSPDGGAHWETNWVMDFTRASAEN